MDEVTPENPWDRTYKQNLDLKAHAEGNVEGSSLDEIIERATKEFSRLFGHKSWKLTSLEAKPLVQKMGEGTVIWTAHVEADEI